MGGNGSFRAALRAALNVAFKVDPTFSTATFFDEWFRKRGTSTYFLFKKNLAVTNLQHAELMALVRLHTRNAANAVPGNELQFQSPEQFTATLENIVKCFQGVGSKPSVIAATIVDLYANLLERTVVVRPLYGSAAVYLPPGMSLNDENLARMCAYSGYIHSCGPLVFLRRVDKATVSDFETALTQHIGRTADPKKKLYFAVYSHEDHDEYDRQFAADLRHGLDDVKIYLQKFYLESQPLVAVLGKIREAHDTHIALAPASDPETGRKEFKETPNAVTDRTLWLLADHSVSADVRTRGAHRYFVCYDQRFKNDTPLHFFDEDKPAWTAPITIPHTMLGAMLNITRTEWPEGNVVIGDPFVGTGTTVLETLKFEGTTVNVRDCDLATEQLIKDNHEFFRKDEPQLKKLLDQLGQLKMTGQSPLKNADDSVAEASAWANKFIKRYVKNITRPSASHLVVKEISFSKAAAKELASVDEFSRFVLYMFARTVVRNFTAFMRAPLEWSEALDKEVERFRFLLKNLILYRANKAITAPDRIRTFEGLYSTSCAVEPRLSGPADRIEVADALIHPLEPNSCDVIITDPPYGINTDMSAKDLAELYARAIPDLIRALKPVGQLMFCLPERSYIGRNSPFFTHKEMVIQQILEAARELDREVWIPAQSAPVPTSLYRPPFYWESERALARSIIHFHIRSKLKVAAPRSDN
jgi:hypothetical protein